MPWWAADPDHVFWMRAALAIAGGVWIPIAGTVGYLLLRSREQVKLEEQARSELQKLRVNALRRFVDAVGEYTSAKANLLGMRAYYDSLAPSPELDAQQIQDHQRLLTATTNLATVMASQARLLPRGARKALDPSGRDLHRKLIEAKTAEELFPVAVEIAKLIDDYLPDLPVIRERRGFLSRLRGRR